MTDEISGDLSVSLHFPLPHSTSPSLLSMPQAVEVFRFHIVWFTSHLIRLFFFQKIFLSPFFPWQLRFTLCVQVQALLVSQAWRVSLASSHPSFHVPATALPTLRKDGIFIWKRRSSLMGEWCLSPCCIVSNLGYGKHLPICPKN